MAKYRKVPRVMECGQWFKHGDHSAASQYHAETVEEKFCQECGISVELHGRLHGSGQDKKVCPGDWIVVGHYGHPFTVKDPIFRMTYESVES